MKKETRRMTGERCRAVARGAGFKHFLFAVVGLLCASNIAIADLATYWTFNDGTFTDSSGNGHTGNLAGTAPTITNDGIVGKTFYGNASGKFIINIIAANVYINNFTLSFWGKQTGANWKNYLSLSASQYGDSDFQRAINSLSVYNSPWGVDINGDTDVSSGFHHFAFTSDPETGDGKLYIDGDLKRTVNKAGISSVISHMTLGGNYHSGQRNGTATVDEVQLYNQPLSAEQIQFLYQNPSLYLAPVYRRDVTANGNWTDADWNANGQTGQGFANSSAVQLNAANSPTLALDQDVTVNSLDFNGSMTVDGSHTITLNGEKRITVTNADDTATISVPIAAQYDYGIVKTGAGKLFLTGTNTHAGGTTVSGGTLSVNNVNALGTGVVTLDDTTLEFVRGSDLPFDCTVSGKGKLTANAGNGGEGPSLNLTGSSEGKLTINAGNGGEGSSLILSEGQIDFTGYWNGECTVGENTVFSPGGVRPTYISELTLASKATLLLGEVRTDHMPQVWSFNIAKDAVLDLGMVGPYLTGTRYRIIMNSSGAFGEDLGLDFWNSLLPEEDANLFTLSFDERGDILYATSEARYVERGWDGSAVTERDAACTHGTVYNGQTTLSSGWYAVARSVTNENRLEVSGDVHLILCDGVTLTLPAGITVENGNSLTVYGQGGDSGRLFAGTDGTTDADGNYIATCPDTCAGIGGATDNDVGTLTIHGGTVAAAGGDLSAGIGGGYMGGGGVVTIYGGSVSATGGDEAAGIGGGYMGGGGGVAIYGGTVAATGSRYAAGIGGGYDGGCNYTGGTVAIHGGTVTATGGDEAAGIGGGLNGAGSDVAIHGGKVTATGDGGGAAIGKGAYTGGGDGDLDIAGMRVTEPEGTLPGGRVEACREEGGSVTLEVCEPHEDADGNGICELCGAAFAVRYVERGWDGSAVTESEAVCTHGSVYSGQTTLRSGWYVVAGNATSAERIVVSGDVHLILMDGAELVAQKGVDVGEGNRLAIWAQSDGDGMGRLTATASGDAAGIGGSDSGASPHAGTITINGGFVAASCVADGGNAYGAGIGGGLAGDGGTVTVNGGVVTARCVPKGYYAAGGAGIGGGDAGGGGIVVVNGGTVTAGCVGDQEGMHTYGAGIGGGGANAGGDVTINGGTVTATAGSEPGAEAIGKGANGSVSGRLAFGAVRVTDPAGIREGGREAACRGKSVTLEVCEAHEDADGNGLCDLCGGLSGSVPYVVRGWDGSAGTESDAVCTNFTLYNGQTTLTSGWYVVAGSVTNEERIWVYGDVHLILCDGAVLTAPDGLDVLQGDSLTIYGQGGDTGTLFAGTDGTKDELGNYRKTYLGFGSGIGGDGGQDGGSVTIHGGTVVAVGETAAGIGGGKGGNGGVVRIYGGTVTVSGGNEGGAAIGRGSMSDGDGYLILGAMKVTEPANTLAMWSGREEACREEGTTVRLEPCRMHEFEAETCKWCGAEFRPVPYVERGWDGRAVTESEAACTNFAYLAGQERLESGWYVVADNVVNNNRITVAGDVRVILCDRRTLTVPLGITVEGNNSLTVYGQSGDSGRLFAGTDGTTDADGNYIATCPDNCAGIGGNQVGDGGTVTVHGGTVVAAGDSRRGAGIGGGQDGYGGTLTVYGGTVAAQGGQYGAGIGGGDYGSGGKAAIYGGKVTATGGTDGAAIGAGAGSNLVDGELEIVGMRVTDPAGTLATNRVEACRAVGGRVTLEVCEPHEDGDGDGWCDYCGTFCGPVAYWDPVAGTNGVCTNGTPYAGQTTLTSGWWVVSGSFTNAGRIVVDGDVHLILMDGAELDAQKGVEVAVVEGVTNRLTVWAQSDGDGMGRLTATASNHDAGIGGDGEHEDAGAITINGGFVAASCVPDGEYAFGAGIGGGDSGDGGTVTVNGGVVTASCAAKGSDHAFGAGIGGGIYGGGGIVVVNGGMVTASCAPDPDGWNGGTFGAGIGGGFNGNGGDVILNDGTVTATAGNRDGAEAIGHGMSGSDSGELTLGAVRVTEPAGRLEGDRETACHGKSVTLEDCWPHEYEGEKCKWCGATNPVAKVEVQTGAGSTNAVITFTLARDIAGEAPEGAAPHLVVTALDTATGERAVADASALAADDAARAGTAGEHTVTWNLADAFGEGFASTGVVFGVEYRYDALGRWCVVDLSGGKDAEAYPVSYLAVEPSGGFNADPWKTTNLVLRLVEAGTFTMGSPTNELGRKDDETQHEVTLTRPFYIGVFETTQRQWELVTGERPSWFSNATCYATRPVEQVSYDDLRGTSVGTNWPATNSVDETSFLGVLRARTGLAFDLPTEAQWEYACRAGTTNALNNGTDLASEDEDENMGKVGRYGYNGGKDYHGDGDTTNVLAAVGSYDPNAWGLYDMHGNVWEWCLDWEGDYPQGAATNPVGPDKEVYRARRGGAWSYPAMGCRSAYRNFSNPDCRIYDIGVRVALPVAECTAAGRASEAVEVRLKPLEPNLAFYAPEGWPSGAYLSASKEGTEAVETGVAGRTLWLHFAYENNGEAGSVAKKHQVDFTVKSAAGAVVTNRTWTWGKMAAGATRATTPIAFFVPKAGTYWVEVTLDSGGAVAESEEGDNQARIKVKVAAVQKLTFDGNGGTPKAEWRNYAVGTPYAVLTLATKKGQGLVGWYTAKTGGEKVTVASIVTAAAERTLYAHWTNRQTVIFMPNGGTCGTERKAYDIGKAYGTLPAAAREGHAFKWWATAETGGEKVLKTSVATEAASRRLYAQWTTNQTVFFDANGGTCGTESGKFGIGQAYGALPKPSKAGETFVGWYTGKTDGMIVTKYSTVPETATRTLYARWKAAAAKAKGRIAGISVSAKAGGPQRRGAAGGGTGRCVLAVETEAGVEYELQRAERLDGEWVAVKRWVAERTGTWEVEVEVEEGEGTGFYRVREGGGAGAK